MSDSKQIQDVDDEIEKAILTIRLSVTPRDGEEDDVEKSVNVVKHLIRKLQVRSDSEFYI